MHVQSAESAAFFGRTSNIPSKDYIYLCRNRYLWHDVDVSYFIVIPPLSLPLERSGFALAMVLYAYTVPFVIVLLF